ncbi:toxin-antitoxin system YwqK family antitoxin [Ferruginibacter sp.]
MKFFSFFIAACFFIAGCTQPKQTYTKLDHAWLDSIIKHSDSSYTKPYFRTDFVTAAYYLNRKDSAVCQLMKDSAGTIVQVITTKNDTRTFYGQYYTNGQLKALLPLDKEGKFDGESVSFYKDSVVESRGKYVHGLKNGSWKYYDSTGKFRSAEEFNNNGQVIKTSTN